MIHEIFHRFPGVEQSHVVVVKDIAVFIPRILLVPWLKCIWSVNEVEIQILEPKPVQTGLESRFGALGPVIGVPQLCGNKNVFARDPSSGKSCLQRPAYSRSFPYRSAQSKCRNPASSASLVAVIVTAASEIKVPKP